MSKWQVMDDDAYHEALKNYVAMLNTHRQMVGDADPACGTDVLDKLNRSWHRVIAVRSLIDDHVFMPQKMAAMYKITPGRFMAYGPQRSKIKDDDKS